MTSRSSRGVIEDQKPLVCLVHLGMNFGGVETWILRTANNLRASGIDVAVAAPSGPISDLLPSGIFRIDFKNITQLRDSLVRLHRENHFSAIHLHFFKPVRFYYGIWLQLSLARIPITVRVGIVHPRAGFRDNESCHIQFLSKIAMKFAPINSIWYMSRAVRGSHETKWKADLSRYPLVRMSLSKTKDTSLLFKRSERDARRIRICSVGRLVPFKAYNIGAPILVKRLTDQGVDISWDIFGNGPCIAEIKCAINNNNVEDRVRLMGELAYEKLDETIADYDVFVGMGTAALEAAALGVPTIIALDSKLDRAAGFLFAAPDDSIGEIGNNFDHIEIDKLLLDFAQQNLEERRRTGILCREAVELRTGRFDTREWLAGAKKDDFPLLLLMLFRVLALGLMLADHAHYFRRRT